MSDQELQEAVSSSIARAGGLYYRLVVVVCEDDGAGLGLARDLGLRRINVGVELGEKLLDIPLGQRSLRVERFMEEMVSEVPGRIVVLDRLEILFEDSLRVNPLGIVQRLSRDRTIVALWRSRIEADNLVYSKQGHREYRSYPARDILLVDADRGETL